jgi:hypothetical protein
MEVDEKRSAFSGNIFYQQGRQNLVMSWQESDED